MFAVTRVSLPQFWTACNNYSSVDVTSLNAFYHHLPFMTTFAWQQEWLQNSSSTVHVLHTFPLEFTVTNKFVKILIVINFM